MEGPAAAWNVYGRSADTKNVGGIRQKVPWMHGKLTDGSVNTQKLTESSTNQLSCLQGTIVNFPCGRRTFLQIYSIFHASTDPFDNSQCDHRNFRQLLSTFRASTGPSINFRKLDARPQDLPLTYCVATRPAINILCSRETSCQHSVRPRDLPSIFFNFTCLRGTFCELFVRLWDLLSTFRASK